MSSFNGDVAHQKKLETAKEKKELADKAFQASDLSTGASLGSLLSEFTALLKDWLVWGEQL
jgi:hypothetical protein